MATIGKITLKHCCGVVGISQRFNNGSYMFFSTSSYRMYDKTKYSPKYYRYKENLDSKRCYQYILSLSEVKRSYLQKLQMEYELMKASGTYEVPKTMNNCRWIDIIHIEEVEYMEYLYKTFLTDDNELIERERKTMITEDLMASYIDKIKNDAYTDKAMLYFDNDCVRNRQLTQNNSTDLCSLKFSRDIIIDFGKLKRLEDLHSFLLSKTRKLRYVLEMNRKHRQPLNFHVTNCGQMKNLGTEYMYMYQNEFNRLKEDYPLVTFYDEDVFTDFEKDQIVYISHWDADYLHDCSDHIPVLFLDDNINNHKLFVDRVNSHGVKHASLPVRRYIQFSPKVRYFFSVAEYVGVLQDVYFHHDWQKAFLDNILLPSHRFVLHETLSEQNIHTPISRQSFREILSDMEEN